ncbi:NAD(P)-binding protein [Thozetella sp. PMI_491]|nr:NAD(P)-binding protein [Thozetella sp. PMI_491]
MMRIAIAGGGGFAYLLAQELTQSANAVLVLTRNLHPEFEQDFPGCQVAVVDFGNVEELRYTLQGVDLLISTIANSEQLNLIDAARRARVRLFVPAEFEGAIAQRPSNDPLDRGSHAAQELLQRWAQSKSHNMQYTVFSCGIFMERFGPGGLQSYNIGGGSGLHGPDDYLVNVESATAEIIESNSQGRPAQVTLTSAYDVARFIAAAIEMGPGTWPREFRMRGDQMSVRDLVAACSDVRGIPFSLATHTYQDAMAQAQFCSEIEDYNRYFYFERLIQTANGRYHFRHANLNDTVNQHDGVEVRPLRFRQWLEQVWGPAL